MRFSFGKILFFFASILSASTAFADETNIVIDNVEYTCYIDGEWAGTAIARAANYGECVGNVKIHASVVSEKKEYTVTAIEGFMDCTGLTSIDIPNTVTKIEGWTFRNCTSLTSIDIPNGVTLIDWETFYGCSSLVSVNIPNSVTEIGQSAFGDCTSLTSISIPNSVTSFGSSAFGGCSSLVSLDIPSSVTSIEERLFSDCSKLATVNIPNSVTTIESYAFSNCTSLATIDIPNSVTTIGNNAFEGCSSLSHVSLSNSMTYMGAFAFSECTALISVDIPEGVASIGSWGFQHCTSLVSVNIPSSVTSIGSYAFADCSSLSSIKVDEKNTTYDSRNNCNAIIETATNTLTLGCGNTIIPNDVTTIQDYAFSGCSELTSINFPSGVTKIGMGAFRNCTKLVTIYFADSMTEIGSYAFFNCTSLKSVECNWTDLSKVNVLEGAFYMITSGATLYVPAGTKEMYAKTSPWSSFREIVEKEGLSIDDITGNRDVLISKQGGNIVVSGLHAAELVEVYSVGGAKLGQAEAVAGSASIAVAANQTIVIVKIGGNSMKIAL